MWIEFDNNGLIKKSSTDYLTGASFFNEIPSDLTVNPLKYLIIDGLITDNPNYLETQINSSLIGF